MSTEYDVIYVQEATELNQEDWESLTTRLRNGVVSFQQLIACCNPAEDTHWLHKRTTNGTTVELISKHKDNPMLWDAEEGEWTPRGRNYMERLDGLSGVRRRRLLEGEWSSAEGVVYEEWDAGSHLIDHFDPPADWPRFWTVDFGFTNPFVCQFWAEDPDGRLYLYQEWYRTQMLVSEHAAELRAIADGIPRAIICDHDAEGRAQLATILGQRTIAAKKDVRDGIQAVKERLKPAGDGRPRLFIMRDALVQPDPWLAEQAKPTCMAEEITGYVWAHSRMGVKEEPVKDNDHGMDALRYMVAHRDPLKAGVPSVPVRML